jgi:hypothetical protein
MARASGEKTGFHYRPGRFLERLQEIGRFFQRRSPQHRTMRRLARRLKKAGIPYAIMGAMAVNAHGAERTTRIKAAKAVLASGGVHPRRDAPPGLARRLATPNCKAF